MAQAERQEVPADCVSRFSLDLSGDTELGDFDRSPAKLLISLASVEDFINRN